MSGLTSGTTGACSAGASTDSVVSVSGAASDSSAVRGGLGGIRFFGLLLRLGLDLDFDLHLRLVIHVGKDGGILDLLGLCLLLGLRGVLYGVLYGVLALCLQGLQFLGQALDLLPGVSGTVTPGLYSVISASAWA